MFALMNAHCPPALTVRPVLFVFPKAAEGADGAFVAWKVDCTVSFANYDAVEKEALLLDLCQYFGQKLKYYADF